MRKLLFLVLSLALMSAILFNCNAQSNKITKVSISKSIEFGKVNSDFIAVFEDEKALKTFSKVITTAVKNKGIVDITLSEYDFEVTYLNGNKKGYHLWLGEKDQNSTIMQVHDTHIIYTVSKDLTNQLNDMLKTP